MTSSMSDRLGLPDSHRRHEILQRLQHERNGRLTQLQAMEAAEPSDNKELMAAQAAAVRVVLSEIEAAERRVEDGAYGDCQACDVRIPLERLEILPYVRYCVRCQQRHL